MSYLIYKSKPLSGVIDRAEDIIFDNSDTWLTSDDVQGAIEELSTLKQAENIKYDSSLTVKQEIDLKLDTQTPYYKATGSYAVLDDRITAITAVWNLIGNSMHSRDVYYYAIFYSTPSVTRPLYTNPVHTRVNVEEMGAQNGIIREYTKYDDGPFEQTLEYQNTRTKVLAITPKTISGITLTSSPTWTLLPYATYCYFAVTIGNSDVSLTSDFQMSDGNYYFILGTFGTDAETAFSNVANNTLLYSPPMYYINANNQLTYSTARIVKYNNKIYWCFRNTSSTLTCPAKRSWTCLNSQLLVTTTTITNAYAKL